MFILLEYKDDTMSGAQGHIAVWRFDDKDSAQRQMDELTKNNLPLELFEADSVLMFH